MGDFAQLPPVLDIPLYIQGKPNRRGNINTLMSQDRGFFLYRQFTTYIRLKPNMRQAGESLEQACFREILSRARNGSWTIQDWRTLHQRVLIDMDENDKTGFDSAVALMCTRKEVKLYNAKRILAIQAPVYRAIS